MGFPNCENHRELLPPKVRLNTDDLAAQMQGYLGIEHHADGSHGPVTADTIDTGPVTIVSDDWWLSLETENGAGNRVVSARITQADVPSLQAGATVPALIVAGPAQVHVTVTDPFGVTHDAMKLGVDQIGLEQQFFNALSVQGRLKLYGQGTWPVAPPGFPILNDDVTGPLYSAYALTATSAQTIYGINTFNATDGARGQVLVLWNNSTFVLTFAHNNPIATTFMRVLCPGGVDLALPPQASSIWLYDIDALRWRCIGGTFATSSGGGTGGMNLDYLGNFVSGPVYNDGDIVVAADGIAYMCVVDGTVTPPEPWPGVGIATAVGPPGPPGPPGPKGDAGTNAAVDATYWTVSGHPGLTSERALDTLANGYVKSTAGEPSIVAVIPVSEGGTGATTPPLARTNLGLGTIAVQDANNVAITGGTIAASTITSTSFVDINTPGADPSLFFSAPAQNTRWQNFVQGTTLFWTSFNFDFSAPLTAMSITRTGVLTALHFSGEGSQLTNLNAAALAAGTVPLGRLGSNAPAPGMFLGHDNQWRFPDTIPSGLIVLSDTPCPPGWTRVNWDGSFLRVNASAGGTGGAASHQHGAGSLTTAAHAHGGSTGAVTVSITGATASAGAHAHTFGGHVSGTTSGGSGSVQTADAGGSFQTLTPPHTHAFGADYGGTTSSDGAHTHSVSGSGSGTGTIPSEAVGITGQTDAQPTLPPYIDVILCRKN